MHVSRISASNFRTFGPAGSLSALNLELSSGLNVLVGENDAGKSSIIDALRYVLLTSSNDYLRIVDDDFHIAGNSQAEDLSIEVEIHGLLENQQSALLDWLTLEAGQEPYLVVHLQAKRRTIDSLNSSRLTQPIVRVNAGKLGVGPELNMSARELIKATYLKPLRDAVAELRPKKGSRLSQVLRAHKDVKKEGINKFDKANPEAPPTTIVEIMAQAQYRIGETRVIKEVRDSLNENYLKQLSFSTSPLTSEIRVASEISLTQVLERLELTLVPPGSLNAEMACERGLGYNNVLFMAAELLLLGSGDELGLILIEEPEAHLHPQLQTLVLRMLTKKAEKDNVQVLVTTHSPNIASSAGVQDITLVSQGKTYPLDVDNTNLEPGDYEFLSRFLDVTKANLFFARGVAIVEGAAEEIILPAIASSAGRSFEEHGISVIGVGGVGLFRYARILQRRNGEVMPVKVACLGDRDIVPDDVSYIQGRIDKEQANVPLPSRRKTHANRKVADYQPADIADLVEKKKKRARGGSTEVFISDFWTLEYDLLRSGLSEPMFIAIRLGQAEGEDGVLTEDQLAKAFTEASHEWAELASMESIEKIAAEGYEALYSKSVSKAVAAQYFSKLLGTGGYGEGDAMFDKLPPYLKDALQHLVPRP